MPAEVVPHLEKVRKWIDGDTSIYAPVLPEDLVEEKPRLESAPQPKNAAADVEQAEAAGDAMDTADAAATVTKPKKPRPVKTETDADRPGEDAAEPGEKRAAKAAASAAAKRIKSEKAPDSRPPNAALPGADDGTAAASTVAAAAPGSDTAAAVPAASPAPATASVPGEGKKSRPRVLKKRAAVSFSSDEEGEAPPSSRSASRSPTPASEEEPPLAKPARPRKRLQSAAEKEGAGSAADASEGASAAEDTRPKPKPKKEKKPKPQFEPVLGTIKPAKKEKPAPKPEQPALPPVKRMEQELAQFVLCKEFDNALPVLRSLLAFPMTLDLLRGTSLGKDVHKLRKCPNPLVAKLATQLTERWKLLVSKAVAEGRRRVAVPQLQLRVDPATGSVTVALAVVEQMVPAAPGGGEASQGAVAASAGDAAAAGAAGSASTAADLEATIRNLSEARQTCVRRLMEILQDDCRQLGVLSAADLCLRIEEAMEKQAGSGGYAGLYRTLTFNLKKNEALRRLLAEGVLPPERFVQMTPDEMATERLKAEREEIIKRKNKEAVHTDANEATTDQFRCSKCGNRKCTYYQKQTRSADEPMTTFVTCVVCKYRWKF